MIRPLPAPDAYREDLRLYPGRATLSSHDGEWILMAHAIERLSSLLRGERPEYAQRFASQLVCSHEEDTGTAGNTATETAALSRLESALRAFGSTSNADQLFEACIRITEQMDDAGAYHTSFSALAHLRTALPDANPRFHGWALANQARIARQLGDLDSAVELCENAELLARTRQDPEMIARATYVMGGLALMRGNHPRARAKYSEALAAATSAEALELVGLAHRGLLVVHAKAGEFDKAIAHGWEAFERASGDRSSQAELLANLAAVCVDCAQHAPAFAAYSVAALWTPVQRVRLPSLGGAALAAAHLGYQRHVNALAGLVDGDVSRGAPPYETDLAMLDLARAFDILGNPAASAYAQKALLLAQTHRFFELEFAASQLGERILSRAEDQPRAPVELSNTSTRVLSSIAALADDTSAFEVLAGITTE